MIIFTDGSSSIKNQSIGSGYIIFENINKKEIYKDNIGFFNTNKTGASELLAILFVLDYLKKNKLENSEIIIYSDSKYAVNELNIWFKSHLEKNFYDIKNKEIIIYISYLKIFFKNLTINWTKGHKDNLDIFVNYGNNLADKLAVSAHKNKNGDFLSKNELLNFKDFYTFIEENNKKNNILNKIYDYYVLNKIFI